MSCPVCQEEGDFATKDEWAHHLLQPLHQSRVKTGSKCHQWDQKKRECVLIVFSDTPVTSFAVPLLRCLSSKVENLVWNDERPTIGFIEFSSKFEVNIALSAIAKNGSKFRSEGQRVEFKRAQDCLELEWLAFLPNKHENEARDVHVPARRPSVPAPSPAVPPAPSYAVPAPSPAVPPAPSYAVPARSSAVPPARSPAVPPVRNPVMPPAPSYAVPARSPAVPPVRNPAMPPARSPAVPPVRNPAMPPARSPAMPPVRNPAMPPARSPAMPPVRNPAMPPARSPAVPPVRNPAMPPARSPAMPPAPSYAVPARSPAMPPAPSPAVPAPTPLEPEIITLDDSDSEEQPPVYVLDSFSRRRPSTAAVPVPVVPAPLSTSSPSTQTQKYRVNAMQDKFLKQVKHEMELPSGEYNLAVGILPKLKELFFLRGVWPSFNPMIIRPDFLTLRSPPDPFKFNEDESKPIIICTFGCFNPSRPHSVVTMPQFESMILKCDEGNRLFMLCYRARDMLPASTDRKQGTSLERRFGGPDYALELIFKQDMNSTHVNFLLVSTPAVIIEAQLGKLLEFMCSFDPLCKPLLILVRYWAKINDIHATEEHRPRGLDIPPSVALDWLVITFLMECNIVPSAREIQSAPHDPFRVSPQQGEVLEIGFNSDPSLVETWIRNRKRPRKETETEPGFAQIAAIFFQQVGAKLKQDKWLVNTLDGEFVKLYNFYYPGPKSDNGQGNLHTSLKAEEIATLRKHIIPNTMISSIQIHIINPLSIRSSLNLYCVNQDFHRRMSFLMEKTGENLRLLLTNRFQTNVPSLDMDIMDLKTCLRVGQRNC